MVVCTYKAVVTCSMPDMLYKMVRTPPFPTKAFSSRDGRHLSQVSGPDDGLLPEPGGDWSHEEVLCGRSACHQPSPWGPAVPVSRPLITPGCTKESIDKKRVVGNIIQCALDSQCVCVLKCSQCCTPAYHNIYLLYTFLCTVSACMGLLVAFLTLFEVSKYPVCTVWMVQ